MERDIRRYKLQLEMLERHAGLPDEQAIALLRSEFALAQNAARFDALSAGDIEVRVLSRRTPQEGVTRYDLEMRLEERATGLDDEQALGLLRRALQDALNASCFSRVCLDDLTVRLVSRGPAHVPAPLSAAA